LYPQEKLQRFVERIPGHIQWIIRLAGGNEYQEGTSPPPLPVGKEELGDVIWHAWLKKLKAQKETEVA